VIALIQRVSKAHVEVDGRSVARIDCGLVAFVAVERGDAQRQVGRMLERVSGYRVFNDAQAKMNLSVTDIAGELLLVPQFTLAAPAPPRQSTGSVCSPCWSPGPGSGWPRGWPAGCSAPTCGST